MLQFELSMIKTVKNNFRNNKQFKSEGYQCSECVSIGIHDTIDTQNHLITSACEGNRDVRICRNFDKNT